ncbi:hypothetical protein [Clostridium isatidis]|uniref:hypothetical protein n=1 Tax=Clostridium isatidis TaxID=182773 RepID=UPI0013DF56B2|nr:hypothetical protein [Clostridium isatidis]
MKIESINKELSISAVNNDIEDIISELIERDEFSCTGNTCPVHSCRIVMLE